MDGEIQAELRQINTRLGRMEAQLDTHVAAHMALAGGTNERVVGPIGAIPYPADETEQIVTKKRLCRRSL